MTASRPWSWTPIRSLLPSAPATAPPTGQWRANSPRLKHFIDSEDSAATMRNLLNVGLFEQMVVAQEGRRQIEDGARRSTAAVAAMSS
ncbi:MAG: hypothetical protein F4Z28_09870 [Gammaproteobacteria bacterium]|nr:hypothetical protein [Gammaproteobacteria bacterium]